MRLLKLLRKKPYCNDFHLILIPILLFLISLKYWPFFIILGLYFIYLFKRTKLFIPSIILILIFSIEILSFHFMHQIKIDNKIEAYVYDIDSNHSYIVLYKGVKIRVSEWNHTNEPGDYISLSISVNEDIEKSYDTDFDYREYLYSKGISFDAKGKTLEKKNHYFSIYQIKYLYMKYLSKELSIESYSYICAMVFGSNTLEDNIKESYSILGISHLLAISGLHIIFLFKVLCYLFLKIFKYYRKLIPLTLISIYIFIIGSPVSALRALLFLVLGTLNKKGDITYTRLDILSISALITLLFNPYQFYSVSFLLSYLVSFILIHQRTNKGKLKGAYKSYFLIYFATFPFVINMTNKISLLSFLLSPIFTIILSFILVPISYILSIFPILDYGLKYIFIFINYYLEGITSYNLSITVASFNILSIVFYYMFFVMIIIFMEKGRRIYFPLAIFSIYLLSFMNLRYLNPFYKVTYMNVGQGDSALIELPNRRGTMLIDAYNSYSYLKNIGLDTIDVLVFTHSDSDHIGDYEKIIKNIHVKKIYVPLYDSRFDEIMRDYSLIKVKGDDVIYLDDLKIDILGPIHPYSDANSNSIVLKFEIESMKYLFTGDMTKEEEADLVFHYGNRLDSDILKVGHHGSDTSSSISFLDQVTPNISIISVGVDNKYGLPKPYIEARISKYSKVYQTKNSGNITISQGFGKVHISTYR